MAVMIRQMELACQYKPLGQAMREARKHAAWYIKGVRGAAGFRKESGTLSTLEDAKRLAQQVLEKNRESRGILD